MLHKKIHVNVILRALAVSSLALSAACSKHVSAPAGDRAVLTRAEDSGMPVIVISAARLRPGERGYAARVSSSPQDPSVKRRGG
jgi:hypothetical protein